MTHALLPENPLQVTAVDPATGALRTKLVIGYHGDTSLPMSLALRATTVPHKVVVRLGGGCKGLGDGMKADLLDYTVAAFQGFQGVVFSGGTRDIKDGRIDPMITDVAVAVHHANPGTVLLGTFPRTEGSFGLVGNSEFVVGEYDTRPNPSYQVLYIDQNGMEGVQDWDGDLDKAFRLVQFWREDAGFSAAGWVCFNGGDVTVTEIRRSVLAGYPTILVNGFGRETDKFVAAHRAGALDWVPDNPRIIVAERDDPQTLRDALMTAGLLAV